MTYYDFTRLQKEGRKRREREGERGDEGGQA
jgi:hypothetical protein